MSYLLTALQKSHFPNMHRLGVIGKFVRNGSLLDSYTISGELRGIGVLKTETKCRSAGTAGYRSDGESWKTQIRSPCAEG